MLEEILNRIVEKYQEAAMLDFEAGRRPDLLPCEQIDERYCSERFLEALEEGGLITAINQHVNGCRERMLQLGRRPSYLRALAALAYGSLRPYLNRGILYLLFSLPFTTCDGEYEVYETPFGGRVAVRSDLPPHLKEKVIQHEIFHIVAPWASEGEVRQATGTGDVGPCGGLCGGGTIPREFEPYEDSRAFGYVDSGGPCSC